MIFETLIFVFCYITKTITNMHINFNARFTRLDDTFHHTTMHIDPYTLLGVSIDSSPSGYVQ